MSKSLHPVLAIFLLALGSVFALIILFGYTFAPSYGIVTSVLTAALIDLLTIKSITNRTEKTKFSTTLAAFLPFIAFLFIFLRGIVLDVKGRDVLIYAIHSVIVLMCSMTVFFACARKSIAIRILGALYFALLTLSLFVLFMMATLWDFGADTVVQSIMSPTSIYTAEIVAGDQGALGGDTFVFVTRQNRDVNFLIGKLKKTPKKIYTGRWSELETMTLRWETDNILYINENKYIIK